MAYFPNGSSGDYLDAQCADCPANKNAGSDGPQCPILHVQLLYNYDQLDKGQEKLKSAMELLIGEDGNCRMRPLVMAPKKPKDEPPAWLAENPTNPERYAELT